MSNLLDYSTEEIKEFIKLSEKQISNLVTRMQASHLTSESISTLANLKREYLWDIDRYEHEIRRRECTTEIQDYSNKHNFRL